MWRINTRINVAYKYTYKCGVFFRSALMNESGLFLYHEKSPIYSICLYYEKSPMYTYTLKMDKSYFFENEGKCGVFSRFVHE